MIHAAASFSHTVAFRKLQDHVLVTDGIYGSVSGRIEVLLTDFVLQILPASFVRWLLLLGSWDAISITEPADVYLLPGGSVAVFQFED